MLQNLRNNVSGPIALGLLALIALSFVFVGVGGTYNFFSGEYAARVDGDEIGLGLFEARYREFLRENPSLATASDAERRQLRRQLLDNLIYEQLLENFLDDSGYRIGDAQVVASIRGIPDFQTDGEFSREAYNAALLSAGRNSSEFEFAQRMNLRRQQLRLAIAATAVITPAEYRRYINLMTEQRLVTIATFAPDTVSTGIAVSDDEIAAYYEQNPALFELPESADVTYVMISRDAVAAGIEVSEETLAEYYEENRYRYLQDEQREARHILLVSGDDAAAAESRANALLARLRNGESFAALAREFSDDAGTADNGGAFPAQTRSQFSAELGSAVFALEPGDIDGPIRTDFGFHIVRLDRVLPRGAPPLEQLRGELLAEIRERDVDAAYRALENDLGSALFDTDDIVVAAAAIGAEVQRVAGITRSGGGPFGNNQLAIDTIFDPAILTTGQTSELVELDNARSAVFRVSRHNEASRQALDEVRESIRGILTADRIESLLSARADALLAEVEAGAEFRSAAEAAAAEVSEPVLLSRQDPDSVDSAVFYSVFAAGRPAEPVLDVVRTSDGAYAVYSLDAVVPGKPEAIPLAQRDTAKLFRARQSGLRDFTAFLLALREEAKVVVNEEAVAATDFLQ